MINEMLSCIVQELGATGLLVIGLYFLLYKPLKDITIHTRVINHELGEIRDLLKQIMVHYHGKD